MPHIIDFMDDVAKTSSISPEGYTSYTNVRGNSRLTRRLTTNNNDESFMPATDPISEEKEDARKSSSKRFTKGHHRSLSSSGRTKSNKQSRKVLSVFQRLATVGGGRRQSSSPPRSSSDESDVPYQSKSPFAAVKRKSNGFIKEMRFNNRNLLGSKRRQAETISEEEEEEDKKNTKPVRRCTPHPWDENPTVKDPEVSDRTLEASKSEADPWTSSNLGDCVPKDETEESNEAAVISDSSRRASRLSHRHHGAFKFEICHVFFVSKVLLL